LVDIYHLTKILDATNWEAVCTIVVVRVSIRTVEVQVVRVRTIDTARPEVAVTALIVHRTIIVVAVT